MAVTLNIPNSQNLSGTVTVTVVGTGVTVVKSVAFYLDNVLVRTDATSPFTWSWVTTGASNGSHTVKVIATRANNKKVTLTQAVVVNNVAPPPVGQPPVNTTLPAISGTLTVGSVLTASNGSWTNAPTSYTRKWRRCDAGGANCVDIAGATGPTYTPTSADAGKTLRCVVTAFNQYGASTPATSAAGGGIAVPTPDTQPPVIANGSVTAKTQTSLTLTWLPASDNIGVHHYELYRGNSGDAGAQTKITDVPATTLSYIFTGLTPDTDYSVGWQAVDAAGNKSPLSDALWWPIRTLSPTDEWVTVGGEGSTPTWSGTKEVRYGAAATNTWSATQVHSGSVYCSNATFGDPAPGQVKVCQIRNTTQPPPPPPPPSGTPLSRFTDFKNNSWGDIFVNRWYKTPGASPWQNASMTGPPWPDIGGPAISEVSTPHGQGFRFIVVPDMWQGAQSQGKCGFIADFNHLLPWSQIPLVQDFSGKFMLPSSGNVSGFPAQWKGVLWEWHTATMSGNNISIREDGRLAWGVVNPATEWYDFYYDPNGQVQLDHWYTWRMRLKWGYDSSCFFQGYLDGNLIADVSGRGTIVSGEQPYLQFGFYSGPGSARNEVIHAGLQLA